MEGFHQLVGDWSGGAAADGLAVHARDRDDLGGRARQEALVGCVERRAAAAVLARPAAGPASRGQAQHDARG